MFSLIIGLGFVILGVLPYGYLSYWLLKEPQELTENKIAGNDVK